MENITFVIPNRGGKHIDFVLDRLKKIYPNEKYIVISQEDDEPFKRGQLFNISYHYIDTKYICFIDNDIFFKTYIDLIQIYEDKKCQVLQPFNVVEDVEVNGCVCKINKVSNPIVVGDNKFGPRGGVSFISKEMFFHLNGFSNLLMGYGYEDNEFACRCDENKFVNINNHICHITHPTRDTKNLHQQLNCVLFSNESTKIHGGLNNTTYKEVFNEYKGDVLYIGVTNIGTKNEDTNKLLELHKPENIRIACEYICDYYFKKYITSDYVLLGVPQHMNIGDTFIWQAEKELLDKLPYNRLATFFFGTYTQHIQKKITDNDTIVFSGGGYLSDVWGGTLNYINTILETFPNNKVVFLPNSVYRMNSNNKEFIRLVSNLKKRKHKAVIFSREYQGIKQARKIFSSYVEHFLVPDVVLSWNIKTYMKKHNILTDDKKTNKILFLDRNDKEKISNEQIVCNMITDWKQLKDRPLYADKKIPCVDWEKNVMNRLIKESIEFVNEYDVVYSNRMHGAILSWLLGKKTFLINNSYGKSKSLYETWLLDDNKIKMK